jgi:endoglucanase
VIQDSEKQMPAGRRLSLIVLAACVTALAACSADKAGPPRAPSLLRGINLGNRLDAPHEGDWGVVLRDTDFACVATRPFDHVRLPVRFNAYAGETPPYALDETFMARVDWAIDQALSRGLTVVVDFHHYLELLADPETHRDRFLAIWQQVAARYATQPPAVVFELLNEPSVALAPFWNRRSPSCAPRIPPA